MRTAALRPPFHRIASRSLTHAKPHLLLRTCPSALHAHGLSMFKAEKIILFYFDPQIIGFGPAWSPDGKYITSYDGVRAAIRVASIATGEQFTLPSATGGEAPTWSPDSQNILFTDEAASPDGSSSWTEIKLANVATGDISVWIGKDDAQNYQYGELAWAQIPMRSSSA